MIIKYIGHSCFKILDDETGYSIVLDPYRDGSVPGYGKIVDAASEVLCSHEHDDHAGREHIKIEPKDESPFMVDRIETFHDPEKGKLRGSDTIHIITNKATGEKLVHYGDVGEKIDDLLTDMRQHKLQVAMVLDDDKKVVGLVTIEDILEELVGEIFDEEDEVDQNFRTLGGNKYVINTHMLMATAFERMSLGAAPRKIASKPMLSFVLETLGHLPREDESFLYENLSFTAKTVVDGRLTEVLVHILDEDDLAALKAAEQSEEVEL